MFGSGGGLGQSKQFGMGVILNMTNNAHAGMKSATNDFNNLYLGAKKTDKELALIHQNISRGTKMMGQGIGMGLKAAGIMGGLSWLSSLGEGSQQAYADLSSLRVELEDIKEIQQGMDQILLSDRMPINKKEALDALYNLKSAGVATDELTKALEKVGVTSLATIGSVAEAMDAYTNTYLLFFKAMPGDFETKNQQFADAFSSSVMLYKTKLPELSAQFQSVATQASMMGMKLSEAIPAVGTLISAGMAGDAGSSLNRMLMEVGESQDKLGLKFVDTEGKMIPLLDIIDQLKIKFGDSLTVAESDQITKAFGMFGAKAVRVLMTMRDQYAQGVKDADEYGIAQEMAGKRIDTLRMKKVALKNAFESFGGTMSKNGFALEDYTVSLTKALNSTSDFIKMNPEITKTGVNALELLAYTYAGRGIFKLVKGGVIIWEPAFKLLGIGLGKVVGESMAVAISTALSAAIPFIASGVLAAVGANMKINSMLRSMGVDPQTGMPIELEVTNPLTGQSYRGKRQGLGARLEQLPGDDAAEAQRVLDRSKKWGDIKVSPNVTTADLQAASVPVGGAATTYQDNRSMPITITIEGGSEGISRIDEYRIKQMTEAIQRQLDQDADYKRLRHGEAPAQ